MTSYYTKFEIDPTIKTYLDLGVRGPVESVLTTLVSRHSTLHMLQHIIGLCTDVWMYMDVCKLVSTFPIEDLCKKFTALPQNADRLDFAMSLASRASGNSNAMGVYLAAVSCKQSKHHLPIDIEATEPEMGDADYIQSEDIECEIVDCDEEVEGYGDEDDDLDCYYVKEGDTMIPHIDIDVHTKVAVDVMDMLTNFEPEIKSASPYVVTNDMSLKKVDVQGVEGVLAVQMSQYLTPNESRKLPLLSKIHKELFNLTSRYVRISAPVQELIHSHTTPDIYASSFGKLASRTMCGPVAGLSAGEMIKSNVSLLPFNYRGNLAARMFKAKMEKNTYAPLVLPGLSLTDSTILNTWVFNFQAGIASSPFDVIPPKKAQNIRTPKFRYSGPSYKNTCFYPVYSAFTLTIVVPQVVETNDPEVRMRHKINVVGFKYVTAGVLVRLARGKMNWDSYGVTEELVLTVADHMTYGRLLFHRAARYCKNVVTKLCAEDLVQEVLLRFLVSYMQHGTLDMLDENIAVSRERYASMTELVGLINAARAHVGNWHHYISDKEYLVWLEDVVRPMNVLECYI